MKMKVIISFLVALIVTTQTLFAQSYPEHQGIYVNDYADLLNNEQEDKLRAVLQELRDVKEIEFTVITINQLSDYGHDGPIEPFATGLFNYWGVGNASRNDGLMLLISRNDRRLRIEVGSGYGTAKNAPMKAIIDDVITPYFKFDDYAKGIDRGVHEVIYNVTGVWPGEYDSSGISRTISAAKRWGSGFSAWFYLVLLPFLAWPYRALRRWFRNRPRICPTDGSEMVRLDEAWEDQHLLKGQITEESLKSVDYDVWQCKTCDHVTIEAYRAWFNRYGACRACGFRTLEGDETILRSATTSSTGEKRIDYHCHNCQERYSVTRIIARKSKSSSSSSSSFGGGSSSGGGASGSW